MIERDHVGRGLHLGQHQLVEPLRRAFHDLDHVAVRPLGVPRVHAHAQDALAEVERVDRVDDLGAGPGLLERRDRVFEVEEHHVGAEAGRLAQHLLAGSGHRQARSTGQVTGAFRHGKESVEAAPTGSNRARLACGGPDEIAAAIGVELVGRLAHGEGTGAVRGRDRTDVAAVLEVRIRTLSTCSRLDGADRPRRRAAAIRYPAADRGRCAVDGVSYEIQERLPGEGRSNKLPRRTGRRDLASSSSCSATSGCPGAGRGSTT